MELAALLASTLAYGRVAQIEKSVTTLLSFMGKSPFKFILKFDNSKAAGLKTLNIVLPQADIWPAFFSC